MPIIAIVLIALAASFIILFVEAALFAWAIQFTGINYDPTIPQAMVLLLIVQGIIVTAGMVRFSRD